VYLCVCCNITGAHFEIEVSKLKTKTPLNGCNRLGAGKLNAAMLKTGTSFVGLTPPPHACVLTGH